MVHGFYLFFYINRSLGPYQFYFIFQIRSWAGRPQCYNSLGQRAASVQFAWFFHIGLAIQPFSSSNPATKFCVVVSFFGLRLSVLLWPLRLHICGLSKQKGVLRELYYVRELSMLSQCSIIPLLCLSDETAEVYCLLTSVL